MSFKVITISRQFGSGGRTIAKEVAKRLGFGYYDRQLVDKIAIETGFAPEYIEEESEYSRSKSFFSYIFASSPGQGGLINAPGISTADYLWTAQHRIITELAGKGGCVIVGRCADYILRDRKDTLKVFIHADRDFRADRIVKMYGESDKKPYKRLDDMDSKRRVHYKHFTDRTWGLSENYDLTLDSSSLGIDYCADVIVKSALLPCPDEKTKA